MSEDEIACFGLIVAREAALHRRRGSGLAAYEGSEPPAARRGVLPGILDHKLNIGGGAGHEGLRIAENFVIFLRRDVAVM